MADEDEMTMLAASRADAADDAIVRIEQAQAWIWELSTAIHRDKNADRTKNRMFPAMQSELTALLERAIEPLSAARKLLVIQAYDERRAADG